MSEKLESIVSLGMGNSRMKDYYDLRALIRDERVDERYLVDAIRATFDRRRTRIPGTIPVGLSDEFANSPAKIAQWRAFLDRNRLEGPALADVVTEIRTALDLSMAPRTRFCRVNMARFTESVVEEAALDWLESAGWQVRYGAEIAPGEPAPSATTTARWSWRSVCATRSRGSTRRCRPRPWTTPSAS